MGKLILLSLPIGNLEDITERAKDALKGETFFLAEDTRNLKKVIELYSLELDGKVIASFHDHKRVWPREFEAALMAGKNIVYVSDAGSPIISDPAYPLVGLALEKGIEVDSFPGVSAVVAGLELSGLPPLPFSFHGFFPRDGKNQYAEAIKIHSKQTLLFFESPHRILDTIDVLSVHFSNCQFFIGRELTKKFQTIHRFKGKNWNSVRESVNVKGEFVFGFYNANEAKTVSLEVKELVSQYLEKPRTKLLAKLFSQLSDQSTSEIYEKLKNK